MAIGPITKKMREYKVIEQKISRLVERKRPLVDKLRRLEIELYGTDRRLTTAFQNQGTRQRVHQ